MASLKVAKEVEKTSNAINLSQKTYAQITLPKDIFGDMREQGVKPGDFVVVYVNSQKTSKDEKGNVIGSEDAFVARGAKQGDYYPIVAQVKEVDVLKKTLTLDVGAKFDRVTDFSPSEIKEISKINKNSVEIVTKDNQSIKGVVASGEFPWFGYDYLMVGTTKVRVTDIAQIVVK